MIGCICMELIRENDDDIFQSSCEGELVADLFVFCQFLELPGEYE